MTDLSSSVVLAHDSILPCGDRIDANASIVGSWAFGPAGSHRPATVLGETVNLAEDATTFDPH